jgi:hypothetical protein
LCGHWLILKEGDTSQYQPYWLASRSRNSSWIAWALKLETTGCSETLVTINLRCVTSQRGEDLKLRVNLALGPPSATELQYAVNRSRQRHTATQTQKIELTGVQRRKGRYFFAHIDAFYSYRNLFAQIDTSMTMEQS